MRQVELPDGKTAEFPDHTPDEVLHSFAKDYIDHNLSNNNPQQNQNQQPEQQPQQEQSFLSKAANVVASAPRIASEQVMNLAKGLPQGAGDLATGFVQGATDLGESAAKAIEKKVYGDNMGAETYGDRLARNVKEVNKARESLPLSERAGIEIGKIAPFVTTGTGVAEGIADLGANAGKFGKYASKVVGMATGGGAAAGLSSLVSPSEETGIGNRLERAADASVVGGLTAGALKVGADAAIGAGKLVAKPVSSVVTRALSEFGNKSASQKIALGELKKGLENEGEDVGNLLDKTSKEGVDLIDLLDPRFATYGKALQGLNTPANIKVADESLKRVSDNVNKLQTELTNLVSANKITPEKAGELLGQNSKKIFDRTIAARRAQAAPLYKKGLENNTIVPLETKLGENNAEIQQSLGINDEQLTVGSLLKSPVIQSAINGARAKSAEFANSPGEVFYGKIYEKTKPVYETVRKQVGTEASTSGIESSKPVFSEEKILARPESYKIPDNDLRVLNAVDNILYDRIKQIGLTGANKEQAALMAVRNKISNILDTANPDLAKARRLWKADTQDLASEQTSAIGKYAKWYADGNKDALTKSAFNILDMEPRAMMKLKAQDPEHFNQILRNSIESKMSNINSGGDDIVNPRAFNKAFFGKDNGRQLYFALGDKQLFQGFKKLADGLDIQAARTRISKAAMESENKSARIPTGKSSAINLFLERVALRLKNSPQSQKMFVDFAFTPQGQQALKQIAASNNPSKTNELIKNLIVSAGIISGQNSDGKIGNDAQAAEPTQADYEQLVRDRYKSIEPIVHYQPSDEEIKRFGTQMMEQDKRRKLRKKFKDAEAVTHYVPSDEEINRFASN